MTATRHDRDRAEVEARLRERGLLIRTELRPAAPLIVPRRPPAPAPIPRPTARAASARSVSTARPGDPGSAVRGRSRRRRVGAGLATAVLLVVVIVAVLAGSGPGTAARTRATCAAAGRLGTEVSGGRLTAADVTQRTAALASSAAGADPAVASAAHGLQHAGPPGASRFDAAMTELLDACAPRR